jgi:hypothetical protein
MILKELKPRKALNEHRGFTAFVLSLRETKNKMLVIYAL